MQFHCHRGVLTQAVQVVSGAVPSRTTRDVLKNLRVQVSEGEAVLTATDGEIGIRYVVPVESTMPGVALLPTSRVLAILRELTDDTIRIELSADTVWIRSGASEFRLSAADPNEFPPVPEFNDQAWHTLPAGILRQLIRRTLFATDVESTRYALGGVLFELSDTRVTLAATDTRRLAVVHGACGTHGQPVVGAASPVVPAKAVTLVERSLGDNEDEVHIAIHASDVVVRCGPATISGLLVQGRFPDYRRVIPTQFSGELDLVAGTLHSAVRQAQIVTNEESRGVEFEFSADTLRLISQAADVGQSRVEIPISYGGPAMSVTFDPKFFADFLRVLEPGTSIKFQLIDSTSAAVMTTQDEGYLYVIMPLSRDS